MGSNTTYRGIVSIITSVVVAVVLVLLSMWQKLRRDKAAIMVSANQHRYLGKKEVW